jgi:hypothetical protein
MRERILAEDKAAPKLVEHLKSHPIYVRTGLENNILNFIDVVEIA